MATRVQAAGIYGFVNGLGYPGDRSEAKRLIHSAQRAVQRGNWDLVLEMGLAYLFGATVGSSIRTAAQAHTEAARW